MRAGPDNRLRVSMVFQGLTKAEASLAFFASANPADYGGRDTRSVADLPARFLWNGWILRLFAGSAANFDDRAGASWTDFWWRGDGDQVGAFWHAFASAWLPATLLAPSQRCRLVDVVCGQPPQADELPLQQGPRRRAGGGDRGPAIRP